MVEDEVEPVKLDVAFVVDEFVLLVVVPIAMLLDEFCDDVLLVDDIIVLDFVADELLEAVELVSLVELVIVVLEDEVPSKVVLDVVTEA